MSTDWKLIAGRVISALVSIFLAVDGAVKVLMVPAAVEATVRLGYPGRIVFRLGAVELILVAVYLVPRTSLLGAILLTGYLGGATASQVRLLEPAFLFPVFIGTAAWAGLCLRDTVVRAAITGRRGSRFSPPDSEGEFGPIAARS